MVATEYIARELSVARESSFLAFGKAMESSFGIGPNVSVPDSKGAQAPAQGAGPWLRPVYTLCQCIIGAVIGGKKMTFLGFKP